MSFLKLHRKILGWEWYSDPNTFRLFTHLLLTANFKINRWQGVEIQPGQLITGRKALAKELRLSEQEIRTSLNKLKSTNEITIKSTNKFSIITICKWAVYQVSDSIEQPANKPSKQQTINQQSTTLKEGIEGKKKKEGVKFIPPTLQDVVKYFIEKGYSPDAGKRAFEYYNEANWKDSTDKAVINWKQKMIAVWFKPENKSNGNTPEYSPAKGLSR